MLVELALLGRGRVMPSFYNRETIFGQMMHLRAVQTPERLARIYRVEMWPV